MPPAPHPRPGGVRARRRRAGARLRLRADRHAGCSDRTIRRRLQEWAEAGAAEELHALVLAQYDRMIGLDLDDLAVDGCITKAPCGGERAGRSPVDRGKQGLKRSTLTDAHGIPLHLVSAGANRHDAPLLGPTLAGLDALGPLPDDAAVHLDRGYDGAPTRALLDGCGFTGVIARKGVPAPLQVGRRWVVERTQSWMNGFGKLRRCTERSGRGRLLPLPGRRLRRHPPPHQRARTRYRWANRPTTRRLK